MLKDNIVIGKIVIPKLKLFPLDYIISDDIEIGQLVVVDYRNEKNIGILIEKQPTSQVKNLKAIDASYQPKTIIPTYLLKMMKQTKSYYFSEYGTVAKLILPVNLLESKPKPVEQDLTNTNLMDLTQDQNNILQAIDTQSKCTLLHGMTGSGKTEIYFHMMLEKALKENKQSLFLLPEISLSKQILQRFEERFGTKAVIWNASVSKTKKVSILNSIMNGDVKIIIGARSALFLPYKNLGMIIVDEEHDISYKQEDKIPYNARDMAVLRGNLSDIPVILGSATPSLESLHNVKLGKYQYAKLESRYGESSLPNIIPIDMKGQQKGKYISKKLKEAIKKTLELGQQAMLFLNRKGYSPYILCNSCGFKPECSSCSSALVYHKNASKLICHHCGNVEKHYDNCPECKSEHSMIPCGPGIERIEEEVKEIFPNARLQLMTKEEMTSNKRSMEIIENITNGHVDIIIGTQIITKGYHFPKLTIVGVIDTDIALNNSDLRTAENSFALMYQLSGRAGREKIQGNIYMQTYSPQSQFIQYLQKHDFDGFIENELQNRKIANMPPISKIASIIIEDKSEKNAKYQSMNIAKHFKSDANITILGPSPAFMHKIKNKYRYRILFIANEYKILHKYLSNLVNKIDRKLLRNIRIDVDPYNFG